MTQFILIDLKGFRWKPICGDHVENSDSLNRSPCCARVARGHAAAPPTNEMKSRRLMFPQVEGLNLPHRREADTALWITAKLIGERLKWVKMRIRLVRAYVSSLQQRTCRRLRL